jgi:phospholipid/cholesterol/gamma-HCH transport system substrate-binding protein
VNKSAPGIGRIAAMVIFALSCFGLLLFLWLAFGGPVPLKPKGYRLEASFPEATTLAKEADVRISGVPVGKVKDIQPDPGHSRSIVTMELQAKYAPLPSNSKAILRQKTLLGETYVELTPGTRNAKPIPENGRLASANVSPTVELDEILRTFRPDTRRAFQSWMANQAMAIGGHGLDLNNALGNLGPFAEDTAKIVDILHRQQGAVTRLISNTGVVFQALSERDGQLRSLVENSNKVFRTTASRDKELQQTFVALPTFQRESQVTLDRLTRFAHNTNPLVTQLRPAARELSPTLKDLGALSPDLVHLFRQLPALIDASRTGFPAAEQTLERLRPLVAQLDPFGRQVTPMLDFIGMYKRELTAFFANTVASTQATDVGTKLHYLRTINPLNLENLAVYAKRLGTNRTNPYAKPNNFDLYRQGLLSYETRHCNRAVPVTITNQPPAAPTVPTPSTPVPLPDVNGTVNSLTQQLQALVPQSLLNNLNTFVLDKVTQNGGAAPRCKYQGPYNVKGEVSQYPHVRPRGSR